MRRLQTPLKIAERERSLRQHPDRNFCDYLLCGLTEGFKIGLRYMYNSCSCHGARSNMKSATENQTVIYDYLAGEVEAGRMIGPLEHQSMPAVHINHFGVISKNHQPGRWRLIVDLSLPSGFSVNDGIEPVLCSLKYTSVDEAVKVILSLGQWAKMAKVDIESAYRVIPVYPTDRLLLQMKWKEKTYVDAALPFGLWQPQKFLMLWQTHSSGCLSVRDLKESTIYRRLCVLRRPRLP